MSWGVDRVVGGAKVILLAMALLVCCVPDAYALRSSPSLPLLPPGNPEPHVNEKELVQKIGLFEEGALRLELAPVAAESRTSSKDPFGNILGQWGPLADANVYRFSSKEYQANSGLYYYGLRFYDPNLQRWLTRDPIGERGGWNLYLFALNNPINLVDRSGLDICIMKDEERWGHERILGSNPDGSWWETDKMPGTTYLPRLLTPPTLIPFAGYPARIDPLLAKPDVRFRDRSMLNPDKNHGLPPWTKVLRRIKTSPETDAKVKERARYISQHPWLTGPYIPLLNDCRHYTAVFVSPGMLGPNP